MNYPKLIQLDAKAWERIEALRAQNRIITKLLDSLIARLTDCHELVHVDEPITDDEFAALIVARNLLA